MAIEESSMGGFWDQEETLNTAVSFPFQSGASNSTAMPSHTNNSTIPNYYTGLDIAGGSSMFSANPSAAILTNNNHYQGGITQAANHFPGSLVVDSMPGGGGVKHEDTSSTVEWSADEQTKLQEGLFKYGNEPTIMRYVKIAATLRDKTVRDVALRCRWMTRKRRKQDDHNLMKKMKERKDKLVESSLKTNVSSALPLNMGQYSLTIDQRDHNHLLPFEAMSAPARHLLEQNYQILGQISANLSTFKLQDNTDLLFRTRNNIMAILNDMREMPGIMSRMPPLPVSMNEDLANSLSHGTQASATFGTSRGFHMKQEPQCR